jgi:NADH dehydrogenase [ubiquinone] 1 alpha subcomplex assembly factor 7
VEASPTLREAQKQLLCGDAAMEQTDMGFRSTSKYSGIPVIWTVNLQGVPEGIVPLKLHCNG